METFGVMTFQAKIIMKCDNADVKARPEITGKQEATGAE